MCSIWYGMALGNQGRAVAREGVRGGVLNMVWNGTHRGIIRMKCDARIPEPPNRPDVGICSAFPLCAKWAPRHPSAHMQRSGIPLMTAYITQPWKECVRARADGSRIEVIR